ncbi:MAG: porin family protein [Alphaproteobacteria bacterium]|jgi:outer membrane immunogenic protein|nr:porin family protein [Alphaproteobacteria bacterium]
MFVRSLSLGVAAAALLAGGAQAADLIVPSTPVPIYEAAGFNWEGLYAGVNLGGVFTNANGLTNLDINNSKLSIGAAAGVNFIVADPILLGLEVQGDYVFQNVDGAGMFLALARVGAVVTDSVLVYAAGGVGLTSKAGTTDSIYALGGGIEVAVTDAVSVRGEVLGLGDFSNAAGDQFFDGAKATVGVFYHF